MNEVSHSGRRRRKCYSKNLDGNERVEIRIRTKHLFYYGKDGTPVGGGGTGL